LNLRPHGPKASYKKGGYRLPPSVSNYMDVGRNSQHRLDYISYTFWLLLIVAYDGAPGLTVVVQDGAFKPHGEYI
jgi:hypothetical protein